MLMEAFMFDELCAQILAGMTGPKPACNNTYNCWMLGGCMGCQLDRETRPIVRKPPKSLNEIFLEMGAEPHEL